MLDFFVSNVLFRSKNSEFSLMIYLMWTFGQHHKLKLISKSSLDVLLHGKKSMGTAAVAFCYTLVAPFTKMTVSAPIGCWRPQPGIRLSRSLSLNRASLAARAFRSECQLSVGADRGCDIATLVYNIFATGRATRTVQLAYSSLTLQLTDVYSLLQQSWRSCQVKTLQRLSRYLWLYNHYHQQQSTVKTSVLFQHT